MILFVSGGLLFGPTGMDSLGTAVFVFLFIPFSYVFIGIIFAIVTSSLKNKGVSDIYFHPIFLTVLFGTQLAAILSAQSITYFPGFLFMYFLTLLAVLFGSAIESVRKHERENTVATINTDRVPIWQILLGATLPFFFTYILLQILMSSKAPARSLPILVLIIVLAIIVPIQLFFRKYKTFRKIFTILFLIIVIPLTIPMVIFSLRFTRVFESMDPEILESVRNGGDTSLCEEIKTPLTKDVCFSHAARNNMDTVMCERVKDGKQKNVCLSWTYGEIAKSTQDSGVCENVPIAPPNYPGGPDYIGYREACYTNYLSEYKSPEDIQKICPLISDRYYVCWE